MIDEIDRKIIVLQKHRNSEYVKKYPELQAWISDTIGHCYSLESCILLADQKLNSYSSNFFTAKSAVNRYYRDWGLEEVADIYNDLCEIAVPYLKNE